MTGNDARYGYGPVSKRELFFKIAVLKRQTNSSKNTCEIVNFLHLQAVHLKFINNNFFISIFKDFAKITCGFSLYETAKIPIIYFAEVFRFFSLYQFTTLFPFSYHVFGAAFSRNTFLWLFQLIHV